MSRSSGTATARAFRWLSQGFPDMSREAGKFAVVGTIAYVVDTVLFNVAYYGWDFHTLTAKILSTAVTVTLAYVGNRTWTWRNRPHRGVRREYTRYFGFNTVGLGITLLSVWGYQAAVVRWPQVLDNPLALNLVVNVIGVGAASLFRFYAYRTWVFTEEPGHDSRPPPLVRGTYDGAVRLAERLPKRWRALATEVFRFAGIGAVNTVISLAIFNALLPMGPLKANVVATTVATTCSYFMNRHWTYRHLPRSSLRREYGLFFFFNLVGLLIESAILFVARYGMHFNEHTDVLAFNIAKFGGLVLATVFRFWAYRRFVFGVHRADRTEPVVVDTSDDDAPVETFSKR